MNWVTEEPDLALVTRGSGDTSFPIHVGRRSMQDRDTSLFDIREAQGPGEHSGPLRDIGLRVLITEFGR